MPAQDWFLVDAPIPWISCSTTFITGFVFGYGLGAPAFYMGDHEKLRKTIILPVVFVIVEIIRVIVVANRKRKQQFRAQEDLN
jgi:membrane protein DedA with SNARE-associated domain